MSSELGNRLKGLGLALLNATLLLLALVLLLAVLLVWQLRGFAGDMRTGLRADLAAMQTEVQAARADARAALESLGDPERAPAAREDLAQLIARLDALEPSAAPPAETESLLRQLVLAIIATAARGLVQPAN